MQRKERATRDAYEKCVDATVKAARLKGEKQALGCTTGDEYTSKKKELEEAKNEKEIAESELDEASDVAYANAVKAETIQLLEQQQALEEPDTQAPEATQPKGDGWTILRPLARLSPWGSSFGSISSSSSSNWGRARPARERRPCRATRRFL